MGQTSQNFTTNQISQIPTKTGVYQFLNETGKILYVGKAVSLRSRVRSYFSSNHIDRPWINTMIPKIHEIKIILTENEVEALILEANLIKKYSPKYNAMYKDDKRYAWIYIDTYSPFPRIKKVREKKKGGQYFGPYPDGRPINRMLKYLRKLYPFADCNLRLYKDRKPEEVKTSRLCLYYHLGQCTGPCDNLITPEKYKENIQEIIKILKGEKVSQIRRLEKKMEKYAEEEEFEQAAELRDKVADLKYLSQKIYLDLGDTEREYSNVKEARNLAGIREFYDKLDKPIDNSELDDLRIECYDISTHSGESSYGSMVVSIGAKLDTSQYRIFKLEQEEKTDDTAMMRKVLERRMKYLHREKSTRKMKNESLLQKPDLILIDGARAQLGAVKNLVPHDTGLMGISKGKHLKKAGEKQIDEFWIVKENGKISKVKFKNPYIFQLLRDEAHRFAIKHHRKNKKFLQKKSVLDEIPGIGPKRKKELIKEFGSVAGIREAKLKEINKIVKNEKVAERVAEHTKKQS